MRCQFYLFDHKKKNFCLEYRALANSTKKMLKMSQNVISKMPKIVQNMSSENMYVMHFSIRYTGRFGLYLKESRLQNSHIFCECMQQRENGERRFTLEDHAYGASRLPKTSENDCFAV